MNIAAVVTGHSRGLGAALADELLQRGVRVLCLARAANPALAGRPGFSEVAIDLSDTVALANWLAGPALAQHVAGCGQALLINNAGVVQPVGAAGHQGAQALARAVALNVSAPLMLADAFVAATGACKDRRIAHVSSGAGRQAYPGWSFYCASKAALDMHAAATQADAVPGLRIASVAPGVIDTDMQAEIRNSSDSDFPNRARFLALKRDGALATPADAAHRFVEHLLSPSFGANPIADIRAI